MSALLGQPVLAAELQPFTANFTVVWHGISAGHSQLVLERLPDNRWAYSSRSSAAGIFRIFLPAELSSRSEFSIKNGQIIPEHFTGNDGTDNHSRDQDMKFDWVNGRVTGVAETKPVDLPLQPGLLDGMTIQVALIQALLAGHPPTRFLMIDKTQIKEYVYTEQGRETVQTKNGPRQTVVYRSARPDSPDGTWFWCDPEQSFLPVKVERRNGTKVAWSLALVSAKVGTP